MSLQDLKSKFDQIKQELDRFIRECYGKYKEYMILYRNLRNDTDFILDDFKFACQKFQDKPSYLFKFLKKQSITDICIESLKQNTATIINQNLQSSTKMEAIVDIIVIYLELVQNSTCIDLLSNDITGELIDHIKEKCVLQKYFDQPTNNNNKFFNPEKQIKDKINQLFGPRSLEEQLDEQKFFNVMDKFEVVNIIQKGSTLNKTYTDQFSATKQKLLEEIINCPVDQFNPKLTELFKSDHYQQELQQSVSIIISELMLLPQQTYKLVLLLCKTNSFSDIIKSHNIHATYNNQIITLVLFNLRTRWDVFTIKIATYYFNREGKTLISYYVRQMMLSHAEYCNYLVHTIVEETTIQKIMKDFGQEILKFDRQKYQNDDGYKHNQLKFINIAKNLTMEKLERVCPQADQLEQLIIILQWE